VPHYTRVGKITRAVGLKGEVKLDIGSFSIQSPPAGFQFFTVREGKATPLKLISLMSDSKGQHTASFEGITDRNVADRLRGLELYVQEGDTLVINPWLGLIGCALYDKRLGRIGVIEEVLEYPGQFLAKVTGDGRELLVPLREELVTDRGEGKVEFDLPEGLIELSNS
jgi:16S rRNA processing protein RimM